ncbi:hypothetical protein [Pararhizobium sp. DWP3-4]|uniref:hypothetical protein n=1 Tax=unclassified Pararhizobium TaxID=2643050 RepID=UPI003CF3346E
MTEENERPEQDPAEGSRETIEKDLKRQEKSSQPNEETNGNGKATPVPSPGAEAAEPSPE